MLVIFHLFLTQYMLSIFTAARVAIHVQLKNDKILTVLEQHLFKVSTTIWKRSVLSVINIRNWAWANPTNIKKCPVERSKYTRMNKSWSWSLKRVNGAIISQQNKGKFLFWQRFNSIILRSKAAASNEKKIMVNLTTYSFIGHWKMHKMP